MPSINKLGISALFLSVGVYLAAAPPNTRDYHVEHYDLTLEVDQAARSILGTVIVNLQAKGEPVTEIVLDDPGLTVDSVRSGGLAQSYSQDGDSVRIALTAPLPAKARRTLEVQYHGSPNRGLNIFPDQVYTEFSTSRWMPCNDRPGDRATYSLHLTVPAGLKAIASGKRLPGEGKIESWQQDLAVPPFVFGFAFGQFDEHVKTDAGIELRLLARDRSEKQVSEIFAATTAALLFFQEHAGVPFPAKSYTQVIAEGEPAQEVAGFTLLPHDFEGKQTWLLAHELAHQWWGIGITCQDWSHFYLNEGLATFMADVFLDQYVSRSAYEQRVAGERKAHEERVQQGKDHPLAYFGWTKPGEAGGHIVYDKGALVFHSLRAKLGDEVFWRGLRLYTQRNWNSGVTTVDLQLAMEAASGQNLLPFFQETVYQ